jgi:uncharacterized protein involved in exopolysaccharide biosynthesis
MIPAENVRASDDGMDLIALWKVVWARRHLIMASTILSGLVAVVLALTAEHIYRSEVVIAQVSDSGMGALGGLTDQLGGLAALAGVNLASGSSPRQDAPAVLRSRYLVEEFIKRFDLIPILLPKSDDPTLWFAVLRLRSEVLDIREDRRNGTMTVAIDWRDPAVAAQWANEFVALANETIRGRALNDATKNLEFLNKQLEQTSIVELRRVIYNLIENETKTLMLANARTEYAFSVVDPAVTPELRISPRRRVMVMVGVMLGLVLGTLAAFGLNAWTRLRAREVS